MSNTYMEVGTENREIRKKKVGFLLIGLRKSQRRLGKGLKLPEKKAADETALPRRGSESQLRGAVVLA